MELCESVVSRSRAFPGILKSDDDFPHLSSIAFQIFDIVISFSTSNVPSTQQCVLDFRLLYYFGTFHWIYVCNGKPYFKLLLLFTLVGVGLHCYREM